MTPDEFGRRIVEAVERARPTGPLVLDCRWLGRGGVGMATELTLRAFSDLALTDSLGISCVLRGDRDRLAQLAWPGAVIEHDGSDPLRRFGQSGWSSDKRMEMAFHQVRPLTRRPRVQWLHDLIPVHFARSTADRAARLGYLRRVAATSTTFIVPSQHTRRCVIDELGVAPERITVVTYPMDMALRAEVLRRRAVLPQERRLLYVGRFARHKNVEGLIRAFLRTDFYRGGGQLTLVGGTTDEIAGLATGGLLADAAVQVKAAVPRTRILDLLATSAALVQPSFEEGFGLPVWEARTVDLPAIAANSGSLPEVVGEPANLFDPRDADAMIAAIVGVTEMRASFGTGMVH